MLAAQETDYSTCVFWVYPLVNVYKKLWKDPPFSMGKSTINGDFP